LYYQLKAIHHQATPHKKTLVIMAESRYSHCIKINVSYRETHASAAGWFEPITNVSTLQIFTAQETADIVGLAKPVTVEEIGRLS
jgi:hypothetical protein